MLTCLFAIISCACHLPLLVVVPKGDDWRDKGVGTDIMRGLSFLLPFALISVIVLTSSAFYLLLQAQMSRAAPVILQFCHRHCYRSLLARTRPVP